MKKPNNTKANQGKKEGRDENYLFSVSRSIPSDPPNPFFALWCSTSDPVIMKLLPLACGTRFRSDSPRRPVWRDRSLKLQPGAQTFPQCSLRRKFSGSGRKSCIPNHSPVLKKCLPGSIRECEAYAPRLGWTTAWKKCFRCGWAASLVDRRRTECTSERHEVQQNAADGHFRTGRWPTEERAILERHTYKSIQKDNERLTKP
jgi:hypothetical protein